MDDGCRLEITAGTLTDDLAAFVTTELPDSVLDAVEVDRVLDRPDGLASEPITIGLILTLGTAAVIQVGRILERWIEQRRQVEQLELVIRAHGVSSAAGDAIERVVTAHADVAKLYVLPEHP